MTTMPTPNDLINELEEAFGKGTSDRRTKTLQRITDLFVFGSSRFSEEHVAVFDGVFQHLVADIEISARSALAKRLAAIPNAPAALIRKLAFDDAIDVAGPVLRTSNRLDNATLVENASIKSQQHLLAISQRKTLSDTVTDILVERGNRDVALCVVRNEGAKFSEAGYVRLVKRSEEDEELAESVGSRPEIPRRQFLKLLTKASRAVRQKLEAAHPEYRQDIQQVVGEVATEIQARGTGKSRDYLAAQAFIEALHKSGKLSERDVEAFARTSKFEETAVALAALCAVPIDLVERAMVQDRPEAVLIMAKAIGFSWPTVRSILLLRAGKGGISKQALDQSMADFTRLKRQTAQQVLDFQRDRQSIRT